MNRRDFIQRSAALVGAAYAGVPSLATDLQTLGNPNIVIGILSDIHITGDSSVDTFVHTLEYFRTQRVDGVIIAGDMACLLYTSPSPRDGLLSRMPSSA